jgi:hypothetical protein
MTAIEEASATASPLLTLVVAQRLSHEDYQRQRAQLRATYGDNRYQAGVRFEQELARLFARSGWTTEQLAQQEGKSQQHIARMLQFGRFLGFTPARCNSENEPIAKLTEWRFRNIWLRTNRRNNDRQRFLEVLQLMEAEPAPSPPHKSIDSRKPNPRNVPLSELKSKLSPIIKELDELSRYPRGTIPNAVVNHMAGKLRKLLRGWDE